jgi:hypothetical protein
MSLSAVHPQPTTTAGRSHASIETATPITWFSSDQDFGVYGVALVGPLPVINVTRTLAAKLCGRIDDVTFNERSIRFTQRADPFLHALAPAVLATVTSLMFVADITIRQTMTFINVILAASILVHGLASLSWDMLKLVLGNFEFWFLYGINATNILWSSMLFHDGVWSHSSPRAPP